MRSPVLTRLAAGSLLAGLVAASLSSCSSVPKSEVVVSVKEQKLGIYEEGRLKKEYLISTSKFGLGDQPNSYRTPLGRHEVIAKIGHGLPKGAVLKSRSWNGEVLKPNAPGRDPIVSRILWLRGMEKANKNAQGRYIYIHGTTEEFNLGKPASYGCIRMGMGDVVDVFNEVSIGAKVVVTKGGLPHGGKAPKVKEDPLPVEDPAAAEPILIADTTKSNLPANAKEKERANAKEKAGEASPAPVEATPDKSKTAAAKTGQPKGEIKIGPELPAAAEPAAAQKEAEKSKGGFFSLKNMWPVRRSEKSGSPS